MVHVRHSGLGYLVSSEALTALASWIWALRVERVVSYLVGRITGICLVRSLVELVLIYTYRAEAVISSGKSMAFHKMDVHGSLWEASYRSRVRSPLG